MDNYLKELKYYLLLVFGLSWLIALEIWLFRKQSSFVSIGISIIMLIPGTIALFVQKKISKKSFKELGFKIGKWWSYLLAYIFPVIFVGLSYLFSYYLGFSGCDWSLSILQIPMNVLFNPTNIKIKIFISSLTWILLINSIFAFGEELGWRGFLYNNLKKIKKSTPILLLNIIWGIWHAPLIMMGLNYPGYPIVGILGMIIFTILFGRFLCWLREWSDSIFPAVLAHASLNTQGQGLFPLLFPIKNPLICGPTGLIGLIILSIMTFVLISFSPKRESFLKI